MPRYRITTPELVDFNYQTAGLMTRSLACLIDQLLLIVFILLGVYVVSTLQPILGPGYTSALQFVVVFLLQFGYFAMFEVYWRGQSPGKQVFHIRVIPTTGGRLTFSDVLIRNVLRGIDFLPVFYLVGLAVAFFDPYRRRLGDLAAGTIVVFELRRELGELPEAYRKRANTFQSDPAIRGRILSRISRAERDLVLDLMFRRDELDPTAREELFRDAAEHLRRRLALPSDLDYLSDEQTVLNVALVIQSQEIRSPAAT